MIKLTISFSYQFQVWPRKIVNYNFVFWEKMGSSPSYQGSEVFQREQPKIKSRKTSNFKDSNRLALNKPNGGDLEENPEHQNVVNEINPSQRASAKIKESKTRQVEIPNNQQTIQQTKPVPKVDFEEMARSNIPKKMIQHSNSEQEEEQQHQKPIRKQVKQANQQVKTKIHSMNRKPIDEQHYQPVYEKNHRKLLKQKQHGQQFNQIPFQNHDPSHKRTIIYRPHKNAQIDYHQYDSAHIRHKAIQQIHEVEHKKPIIQREPVYEHEKLYPKILKDHHQQPIYQKRVNSKSNHIQNDKREAEQQKMEQLRKINLYRKHKMHINESSHDNYDDTEEPEPKAHPNFKKIHKEENELQKSMQVRTGRKQHHQILQQSMNVRDRRELDQIKTQRKGYKQQTQEIIQQNPSKANFLKKKTNKYNDQIKNEEVIKEIQAKNKQFQEKSIAQIKNQKDFEVSQYEVDPSQLKTCKQCGRKFHQSRIKKHQTICRRLAEQKREQFNAQDQRMISKQQKKFIKRGKLTEEKINQSKKKQKIPKWKAQSIALRAHIKMGKDSDYVPDSDEMEMMSQQHHIDVVNCQFCGRNFNKNAAKTHIPFCQGQYEKQIEKQRFERHPKNKR